MSLQWILKTCNDIETAAEAGGWSGVWTKESGRNWTTASPGTRYAEFTRCVNEDTEDEEWQSVTIRVSDHATAYCREDFSVVHDGGGGDDHSLDSVLAWLRTPA